jgi:hypothetical protein
MASKVLRANSTNATLLGADFIIRGVVPYLVTPPFAFTCMIDQAALDELEHYGNTIFALNCVSKEVNRCVISGINMILRDMPAACIITDSFEYNHVDVFELFEISDAEILEAERIYMKPECEALDIRNVLTLARKAAATLVRKQIKYIACNGREMMLDGTQKASFTIGIEIPVDMRIFVFLSEYLDPIEHVFALVKDEPSATVLHCIQYVDTDPQHWWFPVVMHRTMVAVMNATFQHVDSRQGFKTTVYRIEIPLSFRRFKMPAV